MTLSPECTEYNHRKIFVATRADLNFRCCKFDNEISRLRQGVMLYVRITRSVSFHCSIIIIIYLLQLVCRPVAVVILHVFKVYWLLINLSREG